MKTKGLISMGAALAMTLGSVAASAPASAQGYYGYDGGRYNRGDYYRGDYDGYRGGGYDNRGYYGRQGHAYNNGGYAYRGRDYRYRCRNDGTTGTIVGAIAGGLLGNGVVGRRGDRTAGTLIGGAVGALAGRAIDKGDSGC